MRFARCNHIREDGTRCGGWATGRTGKCVHHCGRAVYRSTSMPSGSFWDGSRRHRVLEANAINADHKRRRAREE